MVTTLLAPLLTLALVAFGLSFILRPVLSVFGWRRQSGGYAAGGVGFVGRLFLILVSSVLLPIATWIVSLAFLTYRRSFWIFCEFLSGVHDVNTYRTSAYKLGGTALAFVGFNCSLLAFLTALAMLAADYRPPVLPTMAAIGATVGTCALARNLLRRMP